MHPGKTALIISAYLTIVSGITLVLRCISRFAVVKKGGFDDALAIVGFLTNVAVTCFIHAQYKHGLGKDLSQLQEDDIWQNLKLLWIGLLVYGISITCIKLSALIQYLRFLNTRWPRYLCYFTIGTCIAKGIAMVIFCFIVCQPLAYAWDRRIPNGYCRDLTGWYIFSSIWIIFTDIVVVVVPIAAVWNLNMPRADKSALMIVFGLGIFACVASILRMYFYYAAAKSDSIMKAIAVAEYWTSIELNTAIVCICLPPLKALYVEVIRRLQQLRKPRSSNDASGLESQPVELQDLPNQKTFYFLFRK